MRIPIYLIEQGTGHKLADGVELKVIIDVKLTKAAADFIANQYENATVRKLVADKEI
jgi:hypothetical protein